MGCWRLREEFSSKTYKYSDAQSLTMYMETSPGANSTSLGTVTLKDTFSQLTWGSPERGEVRRGIHKIKGTVRKPCQRGDHVQCDGEEW